MSAATKKISSILAENQNSIHLLFYTIYVIPRFYPFQYIPVNHHHCLLIYTHRYHSLGLWAIPLKCLLSSFSPWLWTPSVLQSFRAGEMVCGVGLLHAEANSGSIITALARFYHHCTLLRFIKVHSSLIWVILTEIPLIWRIATIKVMTYSII